MAEGTFALRRIEGAAARPDDGGAPAVPWRSALAIGAAAAVAYALTLSSVPALTHDSLNYLDNIRTGGMALYHPHHLAYNAVARVWLNLLGALGLGGDALHRVELLNSLFGGVAAALVWTLLRHQAKAGPRAALAATAGAAFSFGVWFYSVSVEVYILPLVLLLATLLVLTGPRLTRPTMAAAGVLNGLAVVAHQINVLFAVVVVVVAVHGVDRRTARARLAAYGTAAAGVVAAAYGAVLGLVVRPAGRPTGSRGTPSHRATGASARRPRWRPRSGSAARCSAATSPSASAGCAARRPRPSPASRWTTRPSSPATSPRRSPACSRS